MPASAISSGTIDSARLPFGASLWQDGGSGKISYSGGNVGIGTTSPIAKFQVEGAGFPISIEPGGWGSIGFNSAWNGSARQRIAKGYGGSLAMSNTSGDFVFSTSATSTAGTTPTETARMVIQNGGNVGIGTVSPTSKLEVAGKVSASAFGLQTQTVTNTITQIGGKTVSVSCPATYTVISGGCETISYGGYLISNRPSGNGWTCTSYDNYGTAYSTSVYAICVKTD